MNIFEMATRAKYRFPYKGMVSVEDLWDLSMNDLDQIYRQLNRQKTKSDETSLLTVKTSEDEDLNTKIQIVQYIFERKMEEAQERRRKADNAEKRRRIQELIATKQDAALQVKSVSELEKMLNELE